LALALLILDPPIEPVYFIFVSSAGGWLFLFAVMLFALVVFEKHPLQS